MNKLVMVAPFIKVMTMWKFDSTRMNGAASFCYQKVA